MDESTINCPFQDAKIDQAQMKLQTRRSICDTKLQLRKKFTITQKGNQMYISGCQLLENGNLLIADNTGQNVLMEYNEDGHFIRDIPVSSKPYDVTLIGTDLIAVSYNSLHNIEVIDIKKMIVLKTVSFKNKCRGISYSEGQIYVVVVREGIVVLDIEGTVLNTIKLSSNMGVYNITTSQTRIYYTQLNPNIVYCLTNGEETWNFKDKSLIAVGGIAVDNFQNVLVVGIDSNNLLMIQDDGKNSRTLLGLSDGLDKPSRLCYNNENNTLLVCNSKNGIVFLYSVI